MKDRTHFLSSAEWHHYLDTLGTPKRLPWFIILGLFAWVVVDTFRYEGSITGKVIRSGQGVPSVEVQLWNRSGKPLDTVWTNAEGRYTIEDLRSGMYYAAVLSSGVPVMLYGNRPCPRGECDPTASTPILVEGDALTKRVDINLGR